MCMSWMYMELYKSSSRFQVDNHGMGTLNVDRSWRGHASYTLTSRE